MNQSAEFEARWTESRLRSYVEERLHGHRLIVVSNREPYMHQRQEGQVIVHRPPGGLAIALDPVLRACGGTWIAHGAGSADRESADDLGRVKVPPDRPRYSLRRVWLSKEEEENYYDGLANRSLWPLCHVAYTRPHFRREFWEAYVAVNQKFAQVVKDEVGREPAVVFVQDYHLGLLPRLIRREIPHAMVMQFWHIPWPARETFRIFPWKRELLDGLLGNHLLGFQIGYHASNFFDTVDREIEARVDRDHATVTYREQVCNVRSYPISVDFDGTTELSRSPEVESEIAQIRKRHRLDGMLVAVGIDRVDYTKGIPERLDAVDRLLERHPRFRGRLVLLQVGAPSRTRIDEYRALGGDIDAMAERINAKYKTDSWAPIILLRQPVPPEQVPAYHRLAHVSLVTSLHDGMNLVAKEFVSSRFDLRGVLVLSEFAGAARELEEAVTVNPFAVDDMADSIAASLDMQPEEQERRLVALRRRVSEGNVYRWAATMLEDALRLRQF